ncbi:glycosyltransferase family 4 protein [Methanothrix sp.]|uniref:glycosyltransferase family 4 protein n=1 Tax=Methanothrix sp. TaxID=90426 RepID=UPI003BB7FD08
MRILICASEYPPYASGAGYVTYYISKQLKSMGHSCTICAPSNSDIKLCNNDIAGKIYNNSILYYLYGVLYYWYRAKQYIKRCCSKYDIIWINNSNPLVFAGSDTKNTKTILTYHSTCYGFKSKLNYNLIFSCYYGIMSKLEKRNLKSIQSSTVLTGVSQDVCEELNYQDVKKERIIYIPNGVDLDKFFPRCRSEKEKIRLKMGLPIDKKIILYVGRINFEKQPMKLITLFSKLLTKRSDISLIIAGTGELLDDIKYFVKINNIANVIFVGYVVHDELANLYSCSDYYIMSSKYEGQPLTLLEAMASGLPCIVSNIPNLSIVKDANCGIIVDFDDIDISANLVFDYINSNLSFQHSKNARIYVEENHSWKIIAMKYLNL